MSANSRRGLGRSTRGSNMVGPPSFEEAFGSLVQQMAELLPQRLGQMGIDFGGAEASMSQQNLDEANVHSPLEHVGGEAVAERMRPKIVVKAALVAGLVEGGAGRGIGQMRQQTPTGKEPLGAVVDLPEFAEHLQDGGGQRQDSFLVSLADDAEPHLLRVDSRDREGDGLGNPQAIGVDEGETAAEDGFFQGGDQAAAILIAADVGQAFLPRLANLFFVNRRQS